MKKILLIPFLFYSLFSFAQENTMLRTPSLNPDGTRISFSYQGDIWTVPASGGIARRLTIHESYESNPQWSPDGQQLVFQGKRYGNYDLYLIEASGNTPKRLTYHSTNDALPKWGADGQIYFTSRRAFVQLEWESEIHRIAQNGGTPQRTLDATALMPAPSPDGKFLAFVRGACRVSREAYKGSANRNIWLFNTANKKYTQLTTFEGQDIYPDWGGKKLFYLSAQNGRYNIFQQEIDASGMAKGNAVALTSFTDEGIRFFDVSADGSKIVFDRGTHLYLMDAKAGAKPKELKIEVTRDYHFDPIEHKTFSKSANNYALSPNEKQIAFIVHGELFVKPNDKEKKRAVQLSNHPYRDDEPAWLNDSTLLFVSDRNGNFDLFALQSSDKEQANLYKTFKLKIKQLTTDAADEEDILIAPNHKQIVFRRGRGQLVIADLLVDSIKGVSLQNERLLLDGWATPGGLSWSPDSRWLAYALEDLDFNEEIYIHGVEGNQKPINVSLHPRQDFDPVWSRDGTKLGFLSERNNGDSDVWFVWLRKSDWEKTKRDWEEEETPEKEKKHKGDKKDGDKKEKKKKAPIEIDFDDIQERIVQVTSMAGDEDDLMISKDGEHFYFTNDKDGSGNNTDLMSIKWDGTELKTLSPKIRL
ncbi:MAG TPA: peptidase S41, partial [Phaeodactylibacter sp.]|nr:peptidase S41 [Phaeodactylibacter sp.]